MAGVALILGAAAALGLGAMALNRKDAKANPAGPPGTPEGEWTENDLALVTEFRQMKDGRTARYWRMAPALVMLGSLDNMTAELVTAAPDGSAYLYRLVQGKYTGPQTQARANAAALAFNAPASNWAALLSLSYWMAPLKGPHYIMLVSMAARSTQATYGKPFAIFCDGEFVPNGQVAPTSLPGVPPVPQVPPVPPVPPVPQPVPPVPPVPQPVPPVPPTPGVTRPWPYDPQVPEMTRPFAWDLLERETDPAKLDLAYGAAAHAGWPMLAEAYRQRAAQLRGGQPPVPVPPIPGIPPVNAAGQPFVIRTGDIPYILAQYYTGNGMRWKEIVAATPGMTIVTKNGQTMPSPWTVGKTIILPAAWNPWAKPIPSPSMAAKK